MDEDTEFFLGILKADNIVNDFLLLILTLETRSLKAGIFQLKWYKFIMHYARRCTKLQEVKLDQDSNCELI